MFTLSTRNATSYVNALCKGPIHMPTISTIITVDFWVIVHLSWGQYRLNKKKAYRKQLFAAPFWYTFLLIVYDIH